jgi:hypothetical protein
MSAPHDIRVEGGELYDFILHHATVEKEKLTDMKSQIQGDTTSRMVALEALYHKTLNALWEMELGHTVSDLTMKMEKIRRMHDELQQYMNIPIATCDRLSDSATSLKKELSTAHSEEITNTIREMRASYTSVMNRHDDFEAKYKTFYDAFNVTRDAIRDRSGKES